MGVYYMGACHSCEARMMFPKCTKEGADKYFKKFSDMHKGHLVEMGIDDDDSFYDRIWKYERLKKAGE